MLDIGTTDDNKNPSSNLIIKKLKYLKVFKSISNQNVKMKLFSENLNKSITDDFTQKEIKNFSSDLVISNATIEHVGNFENQIKVDHGLHPCLYRCN